MAMWMCALNWMFLPRCLTHPPRWLFSRLRQGGDIRQIDAVRVLQALKFIDQDSRPEDVIDELKNQSVMLMEINDANRE